MFICHSLIGQLLHSNALRALWNRALSASWFLCALCLCLFLNVPFVTISLPALLVLVQCTCRSTCPRLFIPYNLASLLREARNSELSCAVTLVSFTVAPQTKITTLLSSLPSNIRKYGCIFMLLYYCALHTVRCNLNSLIAIHTGTQHTDELFDCVYNNFIEEVDAVDNGINDRDGAARYLGISVGAEIYFWQLGWAWVGFKLVVSSALWHSHTRCIKPGSCREWLGIKHYHLSHLPMNPLCTRIIYIPYPHSLPSLN